MENLEPLANEAKAAQRKQERRDLADKGGLDVISPIQDGLEDTGTEVDDPDAENEEDDQIDLLLNEAARVVSDLIELEQNSNILAQELEALKLDTTAAKLN